MIVTTNSFLNILADMGYLKEPLDIEPKDFLEQRGIQMANVGAYGNLVQLEFKDTNQETLFNIKYSEHMVPPPLNHIRIKPVIVTNDSSDP